MPIRVLIIDDSRLVRGMLRATLERFADFQVVGEASDGLRGQQLAKDLSPDVITMDVLMPMMGGIEAIDVIMRTHPTPVVVFADLAQSDATVAMEAMARGAVEVFPKPRQGMDAETARALADTLRRSAALQLRPPQKTTPRRAQRALVNRSIRCLGIVASTGGPRGLRTILHALPQSFPCPIAIVQHTTAGSTEPLAAWLSAASPHRVTVAQESQWLTAGSVVVAPEDVHLTVDVGSRVRLLRDAGNRGHRPSGSVLLSSIAKTFRSYGAGIVLSGMGTDGAAGLREIEEAGGLALIEDPATAVVGGMPGAALAATRAAIVDSPDVLAATLRRLLGADEA